MKLYKLIKSQHKLNPINYNNNITQSNTNNNNNNNKSITLTPMHYQYIVLSTITYIILQLI